MDILNKEECLKALCRIQCGAKANKDCKDCECYDTKINIWKCVENTKESLVIRQLINEHFDNEQKIEWLKKVMDKGVFELCFKDEKSVADWYERGMWHINKVNELSKELKQLKSSHDILVNYADEQLCLIKELTSNPPLKFEELKEGMWIWDDVTKKYMKIYDISYSEERFNVNGEWYLDPLYLEEFEFEQSRFYKYEVKENG